MFLLQKLLAARQPDGSAFILRLIAQVPGLLSCFVTARGGDADAAAEQVIAYASWCAAGLGPSDDLQPLSVRGDSLLHILSDPAELDVPPIAVVRDMRVLNELLQTHSFEAVVGSHVAVLERLLLSSPAVQRHGVSVVQDLSQMSLSLVTRVSDPRMLLAQGRAARFLTTAFPLKLANVVIVDAPMIFSGLWRVVRQFLPAELANSTRFLYRPHAKRELERIFGRADVL
eukprot:CAMPEP_0119313132 /NCGR_PEP_ID=MMETSP1333-20130426/27985_1 /TAXON_ID=418940 /ORGANISM="Scyphosphaera apsteinii, Strain RCC1455" /LENGTH=228 /DNA_ID=CAMNT_0007317883 /DNA_START=285 /DNA_END=971 /DNA_ORIENTATION=+